MTGFTGAVLVGGASRRMGTDKALVEIDGRPMALRVADALRAGGAERVVVVGGGSASAHELGLEHIADRWPGAGPLAGIATAVSTAGAGAIDEIIVVAACDQPDVTGALIADLVRALVGAADDVVAAAPRSADGRREPLPTAWRAGAGPLLQRAVEAGERRADAGFGLGGVVDVGVSDDELRDLDTPEEVLARSAAGHPIRRPDPSSPQDHRPSP